MSVQARRRLLAAVVLAAVWVPTAAAADDTPPYVNPTPPTVAPFEDERDPGVLPTSDTVLGTTQTRGSSGPLPLTGGDVVGLVILGGGLTGVGLVLRAGARRRSTVSV